MCQLLPSLRACVQAAPQPSPLGSTLPDWLHKGQRQHTPMGEATDEDSAAAASVLERAQQADGREVVPRVAVPASNRRVWAALRGGGVGGGEERGEAQQATGNAAAEGNEREEEQQRQRGATERLQRLMRRPASRPPSGGAS